MANAPIVSDGFNKIIIRNPTCRATVKKGVIVSALSRDSWKGTLDMVDNASYSQVKKACTTKGYCWDDSKLSKTQKNRDPWMACYKSSDSWSVDISGSPRENISKIICQTTEENKIINEIAHSYFKVTKDVFYDCSVKLNSKKPSTNYFVSDIDFENLKNTTFVADSDVIAQQFYKPSGGQDLQNYIVNLNENIDKVSPSDAILLNTICFHIINNFPPSFGLSHLLKAISVGFRFFGDITSNRSDDFIRFLKNTRMPGGVLPDSIIYMYLDQLNSLICNGLDRKGRKTDGSYKCSLGQDKQFLIQCIVPKWDTTHAMGSSQKNKVYFCNNHGTYPPPTFESHGDLLTHIKEVHKNEKEFLDDAASQTLNINEEFKSANDRLDGLDVFYGAIDHSAPKANFRTLAQLMVNTTQGSIGRKLDGNLKYLSYVFLVVYAWGHEGGHHLFINTYYQILEQIQNKKMDLEKYVNGLKLGQKDPKTWTDKFRPLAKLPALIADLKKQVTDSESKIKKMSGLISDVRKIIGIEYIQEPDSHGIIGNGDLEIEGLPDVFGFMMLEYFIKYKNIKDIDASIALKSFYNSICSSGRSLSHPGGRLRANLLKINKFLLKLVKRSKGGSRKLSKTTVRKTRRV
jgi:hypothetical protein